MKTVYLSARAGDELKKYLTEKGYSLKLVSNREETFGVLGSHPDMFYCKMGKSLVASDPSKLGDKYPQDIKFNAVCLDKYFIHNLKYTDPELLQMAKDMGLKLVDIKQGYTKCNTVIVDGTSVITSDDGIAKALSGEKDLNLLKISGGNVKLEGFEYGFLGGASGRVGDEIIFNGNLSAHPDFESICKFIESRNLAVKWFPDYPLEDIGTIIEK